ncbi:MAG: class I SAM-dependent methyltransferase [Bacteroidota bacterium]
MKNILSIIPYLRYAYFYRKNSNHRPGHYYSPVVDLSDLEKRQKNIWETERSLNGIDFNDNEQKLFFESLIEYSKEIPFTENKTENHRYYFDNKTYVHADGLVLFMMLNKLKPRKLIEVGSGFSSALILDTKDEFLKYPIELTFIDPNPQDRLTALLKDEDYKTTTIIKDIVQNTSIETFRELKENDILLIDNSHVSKTGSDVNYLMTDILPNLNKGVVVHIHDIFYPFEYPKEWLFNTRLNWNEIYSVHNFLLFNSAFKILFFSDYVQMKYSDDLKEKAPLFFKSRPGSLWIQKI